MLFAAVEKKGQRRLYSTVRCCPFPNFILIGLSPFFCRHQNIRDEVNQHRVGYLFIVERKLSWSLDRVAGQHLLAQVVLVLADAALPLSGGLVLADHDVLGDLVEESVMKC
jgi:hypothetical protein